MAETARKSEQRCARLDLLRILSMLLIILMHSIDHSGVLETADRAGGAEAFFVRFLYMLTQVSVNCYVMLSGYFLVHTRFRLQKLAALWLETVFYTLLIRLLFLLTRGRAFSLLSLFSCLFPFFTGRYWFVTIYVGMYLLSPFLNHAVRSMDRRWHGALLCTLTLLFSAWNSVHPAMAGMNSGGGWGLAWFVVLYLTAAWFRLYDVPKKRSAAFISVWIAISALTAAAYAALGSRSSLMRSVVGTWYHYNSLPAFTATIALFLAFCDMRLKTEWVSRLICFLAPSTFGVYLIHAHADLSPFLWEKLDLPSKMDSPWFFCIQIGVVLTVYAVCTLLDIIRRFTVGCVEFSPLVKKVFASAERRGSIILDRLFTETH